MKNERRLISAALPRAATDRTGRFRAGLIGIGLAVTLLTGCGQTGDLYLPEPAREIVTRPATTPPPAPPAEPAESTGAPQAPSSPETADSPVSQPSPTPQIVVPKDEQSKKKPDPQR